MDKAAAKHKISNYGHSSSVAAAKHKIALYYGKYFKTNGWVTVFFNFDLGNWLPTKLVRFETDKNI